MPQTFQIVIFAAIAAVVLFSLYNVLGKKVGRQPEDNAAKTPPGIPPSEIVQQPKAPPPVDPLTAAAAAPLKARDPAFDPTRFLEGARTAYETIVRAYAAGDVNALRPLLTAPVMASFEAAIAAREARGDREEVELIQGPRADLDATTVEGDRASAKVRFLAELRSRVTHGEGEPVVEERRTAELWTFERTLGASDPNWVLARVEPAEA